MVVLNMYIDFLEWIARNPVPAFFLLLVEFFVMYWVYYKTNENKIVRIILGLFFTPQNFVFNATAISILGLELPRETATTKRMKRWKKMKPDSKLNRWRIKVATALCNIVNKADKNHC